MNWSKCKKIWLFFEKSSVNVIKSRRFETSLKTKLKNASRESIRPFFNEYKRQNNQIDVKNY